MNCETYRAECNRRFDNGERVVSTDPHAAGCAACAAHAGRLSALQQALSRAPLETPRACFSDALKARLSQERMRVDDSQWWIGASSLAACALFVIAAWYSAGPVNPVEWIDYDYTGASPRSYAEELTRNVSLTWAKDYWSTATARLTHLASPRTWALAVVALITLLSVNMAEAYRLRGAPLHRRN